MRIARTAADSCKAELTTGNVFATFTFCTKSEMFVYDHVVFLA